MEVIGSIDQGTQSTRFILYDKDLNIVARSQVPLVANTPHAGWVEQDANAIWSTVAQAVEEGMAAGRAAHPDLKVLSIGITNQRETTVWDTKTGEPLAPAIVWSDVRTAEVCKAVETRVGSKDHFRPITGLPISTYFSAYKLKWMLENVAAVSEAVAAGRAAFGTVDSWVIYKLTGGAAGGIHVTDVSNASRTNLMNINTLTWEASVVSEFGFDGVQLPAIKSNAEEYGRVASGPAAGIPIAGCLGDQQAATLGQLCQRHEAKNTYGTGCFMLLNTGPLAVQSKHGLLTTIGYKLGADAPTNYALEGAIAVAGLAVSWLRDNLGLLDDVRDSETLAASVPNSGGVYVVPAFGGLLAPWWRDDARGVILGITQYTTRAHIVRAVLESMCFQTLDVLTAMRADADCSALVALNVDGGATSNNLLLQMQADLLQTPVRRPDNLESTSIGAAIAAGVAVGFWSQEEVFTRLKQTGPGTVFKPTITAEEANKRHASWKLAVERSFGLADLAGARL